VIVIEWLVCNRSFVLKSVVVFLALAVVYSLVGLNVALELHSFIQSFNLFEGRFTVGGVCVI